MKDFRSELDTVYIISRARPECRTASTLEKMGYPFPFYICVQEDDPCIEEYRESYGEILRTYDINKELEGTDLLDNLPRIDGKNGDAATRNAVVKMAKEDGSKRIWMLDDDIIGFNLPAINPKQPFSRRSVKDGEELASIMQKISDYGKSTSLAVIGATNEISMEFHYRDKWKPYVKVMYNIDVDSWPPFVSRLNADNVTTILYYRRGAVNGLRIGFSALGVKSVLPGKASGGMSDSIESSSALNVAYDILVMPHGCKIRSFDFEKGCVSSVRWSLIVPKLLDVKWKKTG